MPVNSTDIDYASFKLLAFGPARPNSPRRGPFERDLMGSFMVEFWSFLRVRKKFWLAPIMITMALFGALLIATQGSAIAPFIYTLF
jgi:hypothetical protein